MRAESGQATVEWVGLTLLAGLVLGGLAVAGETFDGRSFGGFVATRIACAVSPERCRAESAALVRAYGRSEAELVREHAPGLVYEWGERQLPMDYRRCRLPECARAPDDPGLDTHITDAGERATVFTRVLRRGGRLYLQYWLYFPDSNTAWAGSDAVWARSRLAPLIGEVLFGSPRYPGFHRDDWEGYHVRIDPDGEVWARASSHGHYQGCKHSICRNRWLRASGWTRVSRGSHAGHIPVEREDPRRLPPRPGPHRPERPGFRASLPGVDLHERTSTGEGLRLIPLETRDPRGYRPLDEDVVPPWRKEAYEDPESDKS